MLEIEEKEEDSEVSVRIDDKEDLTSNEFSDMDEF